MVLVVKNPLDNAKDRRRGLDRWVRQILWRRACQPLRMLAGRIPVDRGFSAGAVHRVTKGWTGLKRVSTCMRVFTRYRIIQSLFSALKIVCALSVLPSSPQCLETSDFFFKLSTWLFLFRNVI